MSDDESNSSFEESEYDSDKELQEAFSKGLLKPGLNAVQEVTKRPPINNASGLKEKLDQLHKRIDWLERLDVTVDRTHENNEQLTNEREDDFKRECSFYNQARSTVLMAIPKLHQLGVVTQRPSDYYAEMAKSDDHMKKVREKLVSVQMAKERSELARRVREERKFASQIQKDVMKERQDEKKMLMEAVKKHKKGFTGQLKEILEAKPSKKGSKKAAMNRQYKDDKYGYGGRKKRSKANTKESFQAGLGFGRSKGGSGKKGTGMRGGSKGQKKRPGKSKRVKAKAKKR